MTSFRIRAASLVLAAAGGVVLAFVIGVAVAAPALAPAPAGVATPSPVTSASPTTAPSTTPTSLYPEIDGARAFEHLAYLADSARGGRFTASAGYDDAARYVADRFAEIGLEPWGDAGTFFHRFRMPLVDLAATPVLEVADGETYRHRVDFTERVGGVFGSGDVQGTLAFVGGGSSSDLARVDVRGKVAIVILAGRADPARELVSRGAAGAIYISSSVIKFSYLPRFEQATLPGLVVTPTVANELLAPSGRTVSELAAAVEAHARGEG
ncbi:MAG: hypothetical protein ACRDGT_13415, partial [Candidatus Limnocylindria bacterium]